MEPVSLGLRGGVGGADSSSEMVIAGLGGLELRRGMIGRFGAAESIVGVLGGVGSAELCLCIVSMCKDLSRLKTGAGRGGPSPSSSESESSLISSSYVGQYEFRVFGA